MEIINFNKILSKEQQESCENAKNLFAKDKKYRKVRGHCHYAGEYSGAAHSICNLKHSVPNKIPIALHNGSNYDNHFIIKQLVEEFKKQFTC